MLEALASAALRTLLLALLVGLCLRILRVRHAQLLLTRMTVYQEQRIHARDHVDSCGILGIYFHRVHKPAPCVRPAPYVHHPGSAYAVVGQIAVRLQNAFPFTKELSRALASAAQLKLEYRFAAGLSVLP